MLSNDCLRMMKREEEIDLKKWYNVDEVIVMQMLDKKMLLEIFDYLNEALRDNLLHLDITIYGGSIMTLLFDDRPATRDIDSIMSVDNIELLNQIIEQVQNVYQLNSDWINDEIKEPLKSLLSEDLTSYGNYSNLNILHPIPEQLLAMKILAARPEPSKDFIDAFMLCKSLDVQTKEKLFEIVCKYVPRKLLKERQMVFIKYLGSDLGYDWS